MDKKTMSVPEAGRIYFGVAKNLSYDLARQGIIPTIKCARRLLKVPIAAMERRIEQALIEQAPKSAE
jgi:hypothetical protein